MGCRAPQGGCNRGQQQTGDQRLHRPELGNEQRSRHGCRRKEKGREGGEETHPCLGEVKVLVNQRDDRWDRQNGDAESGTRQPQQEEGREEFPGRAGVCCLAYTLTQRHLSENPGGQHPKITFSLQTRQGSGAFSLPTFTFE